MKELEWRPCFSPLSILRSILLLPWKPTVSLLCWFCPLHVLIYEILCDALMDYTPNVVNLKKQFLNPNASEPKLFLSMIDLGLGVDFWFWLLQSKVIQMIKLHICPESANTWNPKHWWFKHWLRDIPQYIMVQNPLLEEWDTISFFSSLRLSVSEKALIHS